MVSSSAFTTFSMAIPLLSTGLIHLCPPTFGINTRRMPTLLRTMQMMEAEVSHGPKITTLQDAFRNIILTMMTPLLSTEVTCLYLRLAQGQYRSMDKLFSPPSNMRRKSSSVLIQKRTCISLTLDFGIRMRACAVHYLYHSFCR